MVRPREGQGHRNPNTRTGPRLVKKEENILRPPSVDEKVARRRRHFVLDLTEEHERDTSRGPFPVKGKWDPQKSRVATLHRTSVGHELKAGLKDAMVPSAECLLCWECVPRALGR